MTILHKGGDGITLKYQIFSEIFQKNIEIFGHFVK